MRVHRGVRDSRQSIYQVILFYNLKCVIIDYNSGRVLFCVRRRTVRSQLG